MNETRDWTTIPDFHDGQLGAFRLIRPGIWIGKVSLEQNYKGFCEELRCVLVIHGGDERPDSRLLQFTKEAIPHLDRYRLAACKFLATDECHMPVVEFFLEDDAGVLVVRLEGEIYNEATQRMSATKCFVEFSPSVSPSPVSPAKKRLDQLRGDFA